MSNFFGTKSQFWVEFVKICRRNFMLKKISVAKVVVQ